MLQAEDFVNAQPHENDHNSPSLAKMAELAGVSWWKMRDILLEQGINPALGPETIVEAQEEVDQLRAYFANHT